jgi:catechol 2,3-dioxygenase-like lactoylglutathione lyase family enzyme
MAAVSSPALRVSNVILRVADLARSIEFYRDRLGMPVRFSNDEFAGIDGGGVTVLLEHSRQPSAPNAGLSALTEVVLEVPDVTEAYKTLKGRGVPFRIEPRLVTSNGSQDLLAADFRDPDGHALSLTGWVPHVPR